MKLTTPVAASAAVLACLGGAPAAHAQLSLTLTPASQAGTAPGTFSFSGTLANPTANTVFLNGDSLTFNGPASGLTLDDSPFLTNAPSSLGASGGGSDTYTGGFFDVTASPSAAPGTYFGTFSVVGGADGSAQNTVATEDFSVSVTGQTALVPEASSVVSLALLLALGLGGVWRAARRKPA